MAHGGSGKAEGGDASCEGDPGGDDPMGSFQGIESGIYVLLAAALIAVTAFLVLRRDA